MPPQITPLPPEICHLLYVQILFCHIKLWTQVQLQCDKHVFHSDASPPSIQSGVFRIPSSPFEFMRNGNLKSIWVSETRSGRTFPGEVARREYADGNRPSPILSMDPVWLLLVLVGVASFAIADSSQILPGRLWCFSSIHVTLVALLSLAYGYKLLLEISEFSTNVIPNPYNRTTRKIHIPWYLYPRLLVDSSRVEKRTKNSKDSAWESTFQTKVDFHFFT